MCFVFVNSVYLSVFLCIFCVYPLCTLCVCMCRTLVGINSVLKKPRWRSVAAQIVSGSLPLPSTLTAGRGWADQTWHLTFWTDTQVLFLVGSPSVSGCHIPKMMAKTSHLSPQSGRTSFCAAKRIFHAYIFMHVLCLCFMGRLSS